MGPKITTTRTAKKKGKIRTHTAKKKKGKRKIEGTTREKTKTKGEPKISEHNLVSSGTILDLFKTLFQKILRRF